MCERCEDNKRLIKWIFEGRCATCPHSWPLERHHRVYPPRHGEEQLGDTVPLCSLCHALITWRLSPAFEEFVQQIAEATKKGQRLRIATKDVSEMGQKYMQGIFQLLAEAEWNLSFVVAMEDAWNEWKGLPKKFGRDALQEMDDREERDTWGDERRAA